MRLNNIILLIGFYLCPSNARAQHTTGLPDSSAVYNNITIVYDININSNKKNADIAETYNGGVKTVMVKGGIAKLRLVTLMRIQSIYFLKQDSALAKVFILKESGKKRYKYQLSPEDWHKYNARYNSNVYTLVNDSITVEGHLCKKAIISIPAEGKEVIAYYSTALKPLDKNIEPMFAGLPGMVLKYAYNDPEGTINITANKISFEKIDDKFVEVPTKGYDQKSYSSLGGQ